MRIYLAFAIFLAALWLYERARRNVADVPLPWTDELDNDWLAEW